MYSQTQAILKSVCEKYAEQYGCTELTQTSGSPFYSCELNRVPSILYPVVVNDTNQSDYDQTPFDLCKEQCKDTHKIVRLEIYIDEHNNGHLLKPVIVCDLVSSRHKF